MAVNINGMNFRLTSFTGALIILSPLRFANLVFYKYLKESIKKIYIF